MYDVNETQCLLAARDGFDAESPSVMLTQLHRLEACLAEGAIPNATMVRKDNRLASSAFHINVNDYHDVCMYVCRMVTMPLPLHWAYIEPPSEEDRRTSLPWPVC
jgi:hypothetical protein